MNTDLSAPIRLFSYKQTHDTGFAPNPFHGVLTLATCKPMIRKHKQVGDWIAGFTSSALTKGGVPVGRERLIYLMRVGEVLPLERYFADPRFFAKRASHPGESNATCVQGVGDNIYERRGGEWIQHPNRSHQLRHLPRDTGGRNALIAGEFFYFGSDALIIPGEIRPRVPKYQSAHGVKTECSALARAFIDYVRSRAPGIPARPHQWKTGDESWRQS